MPSLLEIVLPMRVQKAGLAPSTGESENQLDHQKGFQAGYEEGRLRGEWETLRRQQEDKKHLQTLIRSLENLHREFEVLLGEHMPDLIHNAVNRVFRKHRFTMEEISGEVAALLGDMEQAGRISLECAPAELAQLSSRLEEYEVIPDRAKWTLEANSNLQPGEFLLKSDLGDVDGRHSSRIRQIRMAIEGI